MRKRVCLLRHLAILRLYASDRGSGSNIHLHHITIGDESPMTVQLISCSSLDYIKAFSSHSFLRFVVRPREHIFFCFVWYDYGIDISEDIV